EAGIHGRKGLENRGPWIPAFAGLTVQERIVPTCGGMRPPGGPDGARIVSFRVIASGSRRPLPAIGEEMKPLLSILLLLLLAGPATAAPASTPGWTADNGNGSFTNPLFHDE